jgi:hypothetical protein
MVGYDIKMDLTEMCLRMRTGFVSREIGVASTAVNLLECFSSCSLRKWDSVHGFALSVFSGGT